MLLWKKMAVLGVIGTLFAAVPTWLYMSDALGALGVTNLERAGIAPANRMLDWVQQVQQHRALSAAALGGNATLRPQREAKQQQADATVAALRAQLPADAKAVATALDGNTGDWKALAGAAAAASIGVADSNTRHTALIERQLATLELLLDHYGLSLDPAAETYYMIVATYLQWPQLAEAMGQARARGTGLLATHKATPEDRVALSSTLDKVRDRMARADQAVEKALAASPQLKASLAAPLAAAQQAAREVLDVAQRNIVAAPELTYSSTDYVALTTKAIDTQFELIAKASAATDALLQARAGRERGSMLTLLGALAVLFAGGAVIGWWITRGLLRQLGGEPGDAAQVAQRVADGDLGFAIPVRAGDQRSLMHALERMQQSLAATVRAVRSQAEGVASASTQIAQGNNDLSARTEQQASALQETAASMEQLSSTVKQNADNARQGNQLARNASSVAVQGGEAVGEVVQTMKGINDSSRKIGDITSVIDAIAFQTNILALNAAVEAARAGELGRGFAVVASEVRSLAQRSAEAAKEIKALITDSVERVERGSALVDRAGATMDEVVQSIKRVTDLMGEVDAASNEQSAGVAQIDQAVQQMDQTTQQNAALVEQSAAAAESLNQQARQLVESVAVFKLAPDTAAAAHAG